MRLKSLVSTLGISSAILLSSFLLTDCTCKISDEQKAQINELRSKERSLADDIAKKEKQSARIKDELNARASEFKKCDDEKEFVKGKLADWPNVWPDYKPESK
jgi:hypothetical protein